MGLTVPPPNTRAILDDANTVECAYCGRIHYSHDLVCQGCGSTEVRIKTEPHELLEVTCVGDAMRRFINTATGRII